MVKKFPILPQPPAMVACPVCGEKVYPRLDYTTKEERIPNHERTPLPGDTRLVACEGSDQLVPKKTV